MRNSTPRSRSHKPHRAECAVYRSDGLEYRSQQRQHVGEALLGVLITMSGILLPNHAHMRLPAGVMKTAICSVCAVLNSQ
jgi:hypothetical protein